MATVVFSEHLVEQNERKTALAKEWQLLGGDESSHTIYFYIQSPDAGKVVISSTESSDHVDDEGTAYPTKAYEWTGSGSVADALTAWRSENSSVTEGGMYQSWDNLDDTVEIAALRAKVKASLDEMNADKVVIQSKIDAGQVSAEV